MPCLGHGLPDKGGAVVAGGGAQPRPPGALFRRARVPRELMDQVREVLREEVITALQEHLTRRVVGYAGMARPEARQTWRAGG